MSEAYRTTLFSDRAVQDQMIALAVHLGIKHTVSTDGTLCYCSTHTTDSDDLDILVLNKTFGNNWIALLIDSDDELDEIATEFQRERIRFVIQLESNCAYVIVDRLQCPAVWREYQV